MTHAMTLVVRNGRVWQDGGLSNADILVRDGRIAAVGVVGDGYDGSVLDARGSRCCRGSSIFTRTSMTGSDSACW